MTISNFRAAEPMYLVIVRERNAEKLLKDWARSQNSQVAIENNRMKIFEPRTLALFQVNWPHDWKNVNIWDYWHKRHMR